MHPATQHLLDQFQYEHLPPTLQSIARPIAGLAHAIAETLQSGPELSTGLRKLLEAKDCLVRQAVMDLRAASAPPPQNTPQEYLTRPDDRPVTSRLRDGE